jgi:cytochrome P450
MRVDDIPLLSGATRLGHMTELRDDRFGLFRRLNRECGDIGRISILGLPIVFAQSPELLHEVLVEKARSFVKSPGLRGPLKPLAGEGLFTSDGELWRRQRKLMAPLFTQAQIAGYAGTMAACAEEAVAELHAGEAFDAARMTTRVAMRIAGKTLFDAETLDEADELGVALTTALEWANTQAVSIPYAAQLFASSTIHDVAEKLPDPLRERGLALSETLVEPIRWPGEDTRALEGALAVIERRVERMIADRRAAGLDRRDLLSLLLQAHDDDDGGRMSDKQVRDEIITLFVAGHETTATALAWSLYLLGRHPEAYARARAEALPFAGRSVGLADLPALGYCLRVFKEAMRLYPPVYFFGRQAIADVRLGEYDLPRGSIVLISAYAVHHRPEIWPDPERFDPARFEPAAEEARHRQAYLAFSGGPRTCIGNHFALMEGPIVLATILGRLDLELTSQAAIEPDTSATLRPKGGVPMRVKAAG